jgi:hypothetical protein
LTSLSERNSYEVHGELLARMMRLEIMLALLTRTILSGTSRDSDRELLLNMAGVLDAEMAPRPTPSAKSL